MSYELQNAIDRVLLVLERLNKDVAEHRIRIQEGEIEAEIIDRMDRKIVAMRRLLNMMWRKYVLNDRDDPDHKTPMDVPDDTEEPPTTNLRAVG
jgi:hypothetical protein